MRSHASTRWLTSSRVRLGSLGLLWALGVALLAFFVPPDGQERGDLAQLLGGLHPLAVHLPIALLVLVPVLEAAGRNAHRAHLDAAAGFVLGLAALGALVAPSLGWLLAWSGGFGGALVMQHLWGGVSVATGSVLSWMSRSDARSRAAVASPRRSALYAGTLAVTLLAMAWTGYRGGQLAHGENHLTEHLPRSLQAWLGVSAGHATASATANTFYAARIAPIFAEHCLICHGESKRKGGLRLDSYEHLMRGGDHGVVIKPGHASDSDLFRRVNLDPSNKDAMPAAGKPSLDEADRRLLQSWIDAGASPTLGMGAIADAAAMTVRVEPVTPDYRADAPKLLRLQAALGIRLVPRSRNPTDGLILRTASDPRRCDDAVIAALAPVGRYIADAELARTAVTDAGLISLAGFTNMRSLDLSHTTVTSRGVRELARLPKLATLNLTATSVDDAAVGVLQQQPPRKHLYLFQTRVTADATSRAEPLP